MFGLEPSKHQSNGVPTRRAKPLRVGVQIEYANSDV